MEIRNTGTLGGFRKFSSYEASLKLSWRFVKSHHANLPFAERDVIYTELGTPRKPFFISWAFGPVKDFS